jgi:hypothetical protein
MIHMLTLIPLALAYIYSCENDADALQFKKLTSDEAKQVATVFASCLPELSGAASSCR